MRHLIDVESGFRHHGEPFGTPGQRIAHFLGDERSGVIEHIGVYCEATQALHILDSLVHLQALLRGVLGERQAVLQQATERIVVDGSAECVGGSCFLDHFYQNGGNLGGFAGAAVDVHFGLFQVHVLQDYLQGLGGILAQPGAQRLNAAVGDVADMVGHSLGGVALYGLSHQPVVVGACAANVGILAGKTA